MNGRGISQRLALWLGGLTAFFASAGYDRCVAQHPEPQISALAPKEVDVPNGFGGNPIAFFDDHSWRMFIALNWPAVKSERGKADTAVAFGAPADAVVWETWKSAWELYQKGGKRPTPWESFDAISLLPGAPETDAGRQRIFAMTAKLDDLNQAGFSSALPSGPLIAQNRTYVRYEIRLNQVEYNFVRGDDATDASHRYLLANLPNPNVGPPLSMPSDSVELKAAWREFKLPAEQDQLARYYHVEAQVLDPASQQFVKKTMGLVGLHIVHKTPKRPEWVWSSFEHVDNVTVEPSAPSGTTATFNNLTDVQDPSSPLVNKKPKPITPTNPASPDPVPVQVVRVVKVHPSTIETNQLYRAKLAGTVWANYQLVLTQWPTQPGTGSAGTPFPAEPGPLNPDATCVANATLETYTQRTSCMKCHSSVDSRSTDFSWVVRMRAFTPDPNVGGMVRARAAEQMRKAFLQFQEP